MVLRRTPAHTALPLNDPSTCCDKPRIAVATIRRGHAQIRTQLTDLQTNRFALILRVMANPDEIEPIEKRTGADIESVNLIYKIEGQPNDVDVFELARVLDAFGNVIREAYQVAHKDEGELVVKVKPFETGSFIMDIALHLQKDPAFLLLFANSDWITSAKDTLEALGFIRDIKETTASLIELLRKLKNGKPKKVERKGPDLYEYHAGDNSVIPINSTVHALFSNPVIQNLTINIVAPAERENVEGVTTNLKWSGIETSVKLDREDVKAIRAFSNPEPRLLEPEILEDVTIKFLSPKSGSYGQTSGTWSFTITGTKRTLKAKITDDGFLQKYSNGTIRFYQGDRLKVRLLERQTVGDEAKMEYEITEVLEYVPAGTTMER